MTNLLTRVPKTARPWVATMVRTMYQQPSAEEVHVQLDGVVDQLSVRFPEASSMLAEGGLTDPVYRSVTNINGMTNCYTTSRDLTDICSRCALYAALTTVIPQPAS